MKDSLENSESKRDFFNKTFSSQIYLIGVSAIGGGGGEYASAK